MPPTEQPAETPKKRRPTSAPSISYHARRCSICRHPEHERIDQDFLHWIHVAAIADTYHLGRRAIYRHAHATNLFPRRNTGLRFALGHIIEQAGNVEVTADSIVRAVRLFACLNDDGEWIAPPPRSTAAKTAPARSTHPANLDTSQLIENTASGHLQIDTNSQL